MQTHLGAVVASSRIVVVDLSRVPFMDCATVGILLADTVEDEQAAAAGAVLAS